MTTRATANRADELSGGRQQRVAIARALVQAPRIILADEPVTSLDRRDSEAVMNALARINRERRITVLCTLHSVVLAQRDCSRAVALAAGRVVYDGTTAALTPDVLETVYGARSVEEIEEAA